MSTAPVLGNRTSPRFQVLNSRVQLKSSRFFGRFRKEIHQLSLIDLSAVGIQAISPNVLDIQKEYDIAIVVPAFLQPISAKGRVVWHKPHTGDDKKQYYRVGVEFTYFKGDAIDKLKNLESDPKLRRYAQT